MHHQTHLAACAMGDSWILMPGMYLEALSLEFSSQAGNKYTLWKMKKVMLNLCTFSFIDLGGNLNLPQGPNPLD